MIESELMYHYDGEDDVPEHVTHVTVDPSITVIPSSEFQFRFSLTTIELPEASILSAKWRFQAAML